MPSVAPPLSLSLHESEPESSELSESVEPSEAAEVPLLSLSMSTGFSPYFAMAFSSSHLYLVPRESYSSSSFVL